MLNVHKQGLAIFGLGHARDFSALRGHQKAAQTRLTQSGTDEGFLLAGHLRAIDGHGVADRDLAAIAHLTRHGGQQHAVGFIGHGAVIGLNPADAGGFAEPEAVRRRESIFGSQCRQVGIASIFFSAKDKNIPGKARSG